MRGTVKDHIISSMMALIITVPWVIGFAVIMWTLIES
jgi:hypothetical protein